MRLVETCLALAESVIARGLRAQARAGAKAVIVCEPAANKVYISPRALKAGADIWERYVMQPNLRLKQVLEESGADLIFHDCGELIPFMVEQFATRIHPVMLSLGSSRVLWEDAALVPKDVVLFGNLPTKNFYSDEVVPLTRVDEMTAELTGEDEGGGASAHTRVGVRRAARSGVGGDDPAEGGPDARTRCRIAVRHFIR